PDGVAIAAIVSRTCPTPAPSALRLLGRGDDEQAAVDAFALAACGHAGHLVERDVDDAPLVRAHLLHLDGAARRLHLVAQAVRHLDERALAARPIAFGVDDDGAHDGLAFLAAVHDLADEELQRLERLPLLADDQRRFAALHVE